MLKLVNITSEDHRGEPTVKVIDLNNRNGLEKRAAHEDIQAYIDALVPEPGYTYLHILAMTASEYWSINLNSDYFPEENLRKYYKTFQTNPAHLFRHHINKDPAKSYGKVVLAVYNERMHRIELVVKSRNDLVEDVNSRIAAGDYPATSMALKIPSDTCSICGNVATTRQSYCTHLKNELGKLYPDGRKVYAINEAPFSAHDISIVIRPADVTSSVLVKIAGHNPRTIGGAELAEIEGLTESMYMNKESEFRKFSELIKEVRDDCYIVGAYPSTGSVNPLGKGRAKDLPLELAHKLTPFDLSEIYHVLASLCISPSIKFLAELIALKHLGVGYEGIGELVEKYTKNIPADTLVPNLGYNDDVKNNPIVQTLLLPYVAASSLLVDLVEKRASGIGYYGNGPHIEEPTVEHYTVNVENGSKLEKLLIGLGLAALTSKSFITAQIQKKLLENNTSAENSTKIILVKRASDVRVTSQLAKQAMASSLPPMHHEHQDNKMRNIAAVKATKLIVVNTNPTIGGKLVNLMKLVSLGSKITDS